jgi:hypothetical protein
MSRLPPPPQFLIPPPPVPPSEIFDVKIISQLSCSSIRQHYQQPPPTSFRLILLASTSVIVAFLLLTLTIIWLMSSRKAKQIQKNSHAKPATSIDSMNDLSTCSSRSYETVSSNYTSAYIQSVDTSATTCSIDTTSSVYIQCYYPHNFQPRPYYHILSIPDVVPN